MERGSRQALRDGEHQPINASCSHSAYGSKLPNGSAHRNVLPASIKDSHVPDHGGSPPWFAVLEEFWPVVVEFLGTYVVVLSGLTSRNEWAMGLVFAGLAHASSSEAYYLQANPMLTIALVVRRQVGLTQAGPFLAAQLLATLMAIGTFAVMVGGKVGATFLLGTMGTGAMSWANALLVITVFSCIWFYTLLCARCNGMTLSLEPWCTYYGLVGGAGYGAVATCIASRNLGTGLLNPWIGLVGIMFEASGHAPIPGAPTRASVFVLGPVLGALLGLLLSWLSSFDGNEKEAFLRALAPVSPPLTECLGVAFLILTLGSGIGGVAGLYLALNFCAWRVSGAQFNSCLTLLTFLLNREKFRWTSLLLYAGAHVVGALIGVGLLLAVPLPNGLNLIAPEAMHLTGGEALRTFIFSIAYYAAYMCNSDQEHDLEGFQHPVLLTSLGFVGLIHAAGMNPIATGLFSPTATIVVWAALGARVINWVTMAILQLLASLLTFSAFYMKHHGDTISSQGHQ